MAGHSKWANIKHRKAKEDKKKGKIFSRLIRAITVAAKQGGDPDANPALRLALDKAFSANMTKDTIERAIKRGAGGEEGANLEEIRYEGYGIGGTAVMVDCLTDNKNRTVAEVRHAFSKHGGNLGTSGSVAFQFEKKGLLCFSPDAEEDALIEAALEAGADDVLTEDDGSFIVYTAVEAFSAVKAALETAGFVADNAEVTMDAAVKVNLDKVDAEKFLKMIDVIEDLDDVQEVYSNADIAPEILDELA
ncbi:MAG: YebC/PmpR family DNA-binding transcriptional regulator [Gammaproteobacteria bacterium CG11_big_fil_rev_8_21_14_0_20_46_22]|nr:MAG: YebC/PmpR family DNA-binding transcriptional regulator [Gammaproteobacteria bacterium CG12_big_fil_rev_8_21_14_0_65_46_12]PIR11444.1 MAG: YebC/PmpR family DNA-binding transcriptional regulator [Gammaproteobacteria bacterium CG11_big_fil_rev_8_21_14_0_20_46_22]